MFNLGGGAQPYLKVQKLKTPHHEKIWKKNFFYSFSTHIICPYWAANHLVFTSLLELNQIYSNPVFTCGQIVSNHVLNHVHKINKWKNNKYWNKNSFPTHIVCSCYAAKHLVSTHIFESISMLFYHLLQFSCFSKAELSRLNDMVRFRFLWYCLIMPGVWQRTLVSSGIGQVRSSLV